MPGGPLKLSDVLGKPHMAFRLHELPQGVDGRIRDVKHEACDVSEDHALLLGHLGREQRAEHEVIELQDGVGEPLPLQGRIAGEPVDPDVKQVQRYRPFDVTWGR